MDYTAFFNLMKFMRKRAAAEPKGSNNRKRTQHDDEDKMKDSCKGEAGVDAEVVKDRRERKVDEKERCILDEEEREDAKIIQDREDSAKETKLRK